MQIKLNKNGESKWYSMPDSWDEMSIEKYMGTMQYLTDDKSDKHTKLVMMIHYLSDIPEQDLWNMSISDLTKLSGVMSDLLNSKPTEDLKHIIKIDGVKYGFDPKLRDISLGAFVDIEHCIKDGMYKNLHTLLSVLYRPVIKQKGKKYIVEDYEPSEERAEIFKNNLKVADFNGASVFFYALGTQLLDSMSKYLEMETLRERIKLLKINGDGMKSSTD